MTNARRPIPAIQVGVGNRGEQILTDVLAHGGFAPVALVDTEPKFVDAARRRPRLEASSTHASLAEALSSHPEAEAVFLVTPARFHGQMIREALEAGRHIWVEKPLTYDYGEAQELAARARRAGRAVVIGNQYQYHPLEVRLAEVVRSGRFGKAFHVAYAHHRFRPEMRAFTGEFPALWEQGVHALDSTLAILGHPTPTTVFALGQRPPHSRYNSDTVTNVLTTFADGAQAHLLVTFDSQRTDWSIRVECEHAALLLEATDWERDAIQVIAGEKLVDTITADPGGGMTGAGPITAFHAQITGGPPAPTSIDTNLKTIAWIDAIVRSLRAGTAIHPAENRTS